MVEVISNVLVITINACSLTRFASSKRYQTEFSFKKCSYVFLMKDTCKLLYMEVITSEK